jgi:hypothetical protein
LADPGASVGIGGSDFSEGVARFGNGFFRSSNLIDQRNVDPKSATPAPITQEISRLLKCGLGGPQFRTRLRALEIGKLAHPTSLFKAEIPEAYGRAPTGAARSGMSATERSTLFAFATRFAFAGFSIFRRVTRTCRRSTNALINFDICDNLLRCDPAQRSLSEFPNGGKFAAIWRVNRG